LLPPYVKLELVYQALNFLINTAVELYILLVCLQVILRWANVHQSNPILFNIGRITYPIVRPTYSIIPTMYGIDLAAIFLLLTLFISKTYILFWMQTGTFPPLTGVTILAFAEALTQFIGILFCIIILFSMIGWFNTLTSAAIIEIVVKVSGPFLGLMKSVVPSIAGIDFSALLVIIGLRLVTIFITNPLMQIGFNLINQQ
jgi:YggT family protein